MSLASPRHKTGPIPEGSRSPTTATTQGRNSTISADTSKTSIGPEEAGDYLNRTNFRGLIEYLSAEVIVSRPEDPVQFVRDLLDTRIAERHGTGFEMPQVAEYLQTIYADVEDHADEYGRISHRPIKAVTMNAAEEIERLLDRNKRWEAILQASKEAVATTDKERCIGSVLRHGRQLVEADRLVLWLHDKSTDEMVLHSDVEGTPELRIPPTRGLVGAVLKNGALVNVKDAQSDPIFDRTYDIKARYKTETLLAMPLRSARADGALLGVLVATNKTHGIFNQTDEECFETFASSLGLCVWAVLGHGAALHNVWRHEGALQAVHSLQSHAKDTATLVSLLPVLLTPLLGCEHASVFLVDNFDRAIFTPDGDDRIAFGVGVAGTVASSGEPINIPILARDSRWSKDDVVGVGGGAMEVRNVLCVPVVSIAMGNLVLAVVTLVNKKVGAFSGEDVSLLSLLFTTVAPLFRSTQLQSSSSSSSVGGVNGAGGGGGSEAPPLGTARGLAEGQGEDKGAEE